VCWRVVGVDDAVFDGVVVSGDGFALVADVEAVICGVDGGGDESSDGDCVGNWPVGEGNFHGSTVGDVSDERDSSDAHGEAEVAFVVEVVGNGDGGRPTETVACCSGYRRGSGQGWVGRC